MTMREDREREERERERQSKPEPIVLSNEQLSEKAKEQNRINFALAFMTLIVLGLALLAQFSNRPTTNTAELTKLTAQVDSLKATNDAQNAALDYLKTHTDTTGLADVRQELTLMRDNDEQRSSDIQRMTEAFDRAYLSAANKK